MRRWCRDGDGGDGHKSNECCIQFEPADIRKGYFTFSNDRFVDNSSNSSTYNTFFNHFFFVISVVIRRLCFRYNTTIRNSCITQQYFFLFVCFASPLLLFSHKHQHHHHHQEGAHALRRVHPSGAHHPSCVFYIEHNKSHIAILLVVR